MKKNLFIWRIFMLTFLLMLFSCRNEELSGIHKNSQREEEFFLQAIEKTSRFKNGNSIVKTLQEENEKSHFVSKMKDHKGLPVWDKVILSGKSRPGTQNKGEGDEEDDFGTMVIPLTENDKDLSSILFINKNADGAYSFKDINNADVKQTVFNTQIDKPYREQLLASFILMDHLSFPDDAVYWNIPDDLFSFIPKNEDNPHRRFRVRIHNPDEDNTNNLSSYMTLCWEVVIDNPGCSCHGTTVAEVHCVYIGDGSGGGGSPGNPGGNTGDGDPTGGGGGYPGNGGGSPTNTDCSGAHGNGPFYKIMPCDGEDGGGDVVIIDPCANIKAKFADTKFKEKVTSLDKPEIFNKDKETGYAAAYGSVPYELMTNNSKGNVTLPNGNKYYGYMHVHLNLEGVVKIFSPADVTTFLTSCVRNADENGSISSAYAMVITSQGNYMLQYTGYGDYSIGPNQITNWKTGYKDLYNELKESELANPTIVEKLFVRFLNDKVKIAGLEIYKTDKTTGKASRLSLDSNNNLTTIPCP